MNKDKKILFVGALPPPVTGQSLACEVFLHELTQHYHVATVNINKENFKSGGFEQSRLKSIVISIYKTWRIARTSDALYFTISESVLGNLKDLLIYMASWRILPSSAIHLHGGSGMRRLLANRFSPLRLLNKLFLSRIGKVIVLGDRLASIYDGMVAPEKIEIVKNFAESRYSATKADLNDKFSNSSELRILYLSNMIPEKGYLILKDAVKIINKSNNKKIYLDYAGGFVNENDKNDFLNSISDDPYIRYHGVVHGDIKKKLLLRAHIFALPTFYPYEGQPISILEGYAAGCAVVTTDHSGIFDIFTPAVNGWAVDKNSQASVETALTYCLENTNEIELIGRANADFARDNFSTSRYNSELMHIIDDLLQRKQR